MRVVPAFAAELKYMVSSRCCNGSGDVTRIAFGLIQTTWSVVELGMQIYRSRIGDNNDTTPNKQHLDYCVCSSTSEVGHRAAPRDPSRFPKAQSTLLGGVRLFGLFERLRAVNAERKKPQAVSKSAIALIALRRNDKLDVSYEKWDLRALLLRGRELLL